MSGEIAVLEAEVKEYNLQVRSELLLCHAATPADRFLARNRAAGA